MAHRKWKETKQQQGTAGPGNILGCCLFSLPFLCDIHSIHSVCVMEMKEVIGCILPVLIPLLGKWIMGADSRSRWANGRAHLGRFHSMENQCMLLQHREAG